MMLEEELLAVNIQYLVQKPPISMIYGTLCYTNPEPCILLENLIWLVWLVEETEQATSCSKRSTVIKSLRCHESQTPDKFDVLHSIDL
jgi:hypothetical protein